MTRIKATIDILEKYIKEQEEQEFLRDHDQRFSELRESVKKRAKKLNPPLNVVSVRLYHIAESTFFIVQLFQYKFYYLAKGIVHSIETENPLSLANNTRSLLEQVAVFIYCMNAVKKMADDLKDQGTITKINEILTKAETIINRTYSGEGKKRAKNKEGEAIHVHAAIESLGEEILDIVEIYDYLCEFVHPNYGSNLLVSSGILGNGKIKVKDNTDKNVNNLIGCSYSLYHYVGSKHMYYPAITWNIYHLVELCLRKGAKITNIFSTKEVIPIGDGKSQETAFFFKNARSSQEAQKMSYQYLQEIGYEICLSKKRIGGISDGFIYDAWKSNDRDIWFKIPVYRGI